MNPLQSRLASLRRRLRAVTLNRGLGLVITALLGGALLAGLFLGLSEAFTAFLWAPEWAAALSIVLLLLILVVFPRGFGSWRRL